MSGECTAEPAGRAKRRPDFVSFGVTFTSSSIIFAWDSVSVCLWFSQLLEFIIIVE